LTSMTDPPFCIRTHTHPTRVHAYTTQSCTLARIHWHIIVDRQCGRTQGLGWCVCVCVANTSWLLPWDRDRHPSEQMPSSAGSRRPLPSPTAVDTCQKDKVNQGDRAVRDHAALRPALPLALAAPRPWWDAEGMGLSLGDVVVSLGLKLLKPLGLPYSHDGDLLFSTLPTQHVRFTTQFL
jgi:hypothetical protein